MQAISLLSVTLIVFATGACGGGQARAQSTGPGGTGHTSADGTSIDDADTPGGDAGFTDGDDPIDEEPEEPAAVTFVLVNKSADKDLVLSLDRGWQPVITAYSGQPPEATPILMFPTHCTEACDAPEEERCPHCPEPETRKQKKEAERREVVPPGESLEVPWDGQIYVYEKTRGQRGERAVRCQCYRTEEVAPETYTVRAFGLRLTRSAEERSKMVMAQGEMTLPADEPLRVELEFDPDQQAASGKKTGKTR